MIDDHHAPSPAEIADAESDYLDALAAASDASAMGCTLAHDDILAAARIAIAWSAAADAGRRWLAAREAAAHAALGAAVAAAHAEGP